VLWSVVTFFTLCDFTKMNMPSSEILGRGPSYFFISSFQLKRKQKVLKIRWCFPGCFFLKFWGKKSGGETSSSSFWLCVLDSLFSALRPIYVETPIKCTVRCFIVHKKWKDPQTCSLHELKKIRLFSRCLCFNFFSTCFLCYIKTLCFRLSWKERSYLVSFF